MPGQRPHAPCVATGVCTRRAAYGARALGVKQTFVGAAETGARHTPLEVGTGRAARRLPSSIVSSRKLPIVAVVGRPNVGKSSLFNRFAGHRRALVEDTPGITRDRITEEIEAAGRRILLVDTAGLEAKAEAGLPAAIQAQARAAVEQADAILFVVDGKAGCLPDDVGIARALRRTSKPVTLAVNKIDKPAHASRLAEFFSLGIERTRAVSAEQATGAWDALEELVAALPRPEEGPEPQADGAIRVAIVGRPNVGKSSLVNRLAGFERVVVSDEPGTTRDAIDTRVERNGEAFVLVDTAGLRRPGRRTGVVERASALMTLRSLERSDVVLVVVDAAEGFTDSDARVAALVRERGRACAVLANKWDVVERRRDGGRQRAREELARGLRFMPDAPVLPVSAKTGKGVEEIFPLVHRLGAAASRRVPTAELNRWLQATVEKHGPDMAQRGTRKRPIKFFYATQAGVRPPTFVLFCTDPTSIRTSYRRFLENQLRESFDLEGTPVRLRLRARGEHADPE
jgi:GTP-binding protein